MFSCHFFVLFAGLLTTVGAQKYTLLGQLSKQTEALAHGMELANRIGNVGYNGFGKAAFAAYASSGGGYSGSTNVKFQYLTTNVGNGFSASTGYFTAPYDGVYVFEFSIKVYSGANNYPGIYKNGSRQMYMQCQTYSTSYETCSKTVPLQLRRGDNVSIRSASGTLYVQAPFSSFSGWML